MMDYNFVRIHQTLRIEVSDIVALLEASERRGLERAA
jgi:hypothetical protein